MKLEGLGGPGGGDGGGGDEVGVGGLPGRVGGGGDAAFGGQRGFCRFRGLQAGDTVVKICGNQRTYDYCDHSEDNNQTHQDRHDHDHYRDTCECLRRSLRKWNQWTKIAPGPTQMCWEKNSALGGSEKYMSI